MSDVIYDDPSEEDTDVEYQEIFDHKAQKLAKFPGTRVHKEHGGSGFVPKEKEWARGDQDPFVTMDSDIRLLGRNEEKILRALAAIGNGRVGGRLLIGIDKREIHGTKYGSMVTRLLQQYPGYAVSTTRVHGRKKGEEPRTFFEVRASPCQDILSVNGVVRYPCDGWYKIALKNFKEFKEMGVVCMKGCLPSVSHRKGTILRQPAKNYVVSVRQKEIDSAIAAICNVAYFLQTKQEVLIGVEVKHGDARVTSGTQHAAVREAAKRLGISAEIQSQNVTRSSDIVLVSISPQGLVISKDKIFVIGDQYVQPLCVIVDEPEGRRLLAKLVSEPEGRPDVRAPGDYPVPIPKMKKTHLTTIPEREEEKTMPPMKNAWSDQVPPAPVTKPPSFVTAKPTPGYVEPDKIRARVKPGLRRQKTLDKFFEDLKKSQESARLKEQAQKSSILGVTSKDIRTEYEGAGVLYHLADSD